MLEVQLFRRNPERCGNLLSAELAQGLAGLLFRVGGLRDAELFGHVRLSQSKVLAPRTHGACAIDGATDDVVGY